MKSALDPRGVGEGAGYGGGAAGDIEYDGLAVTALRRAGRDIDDAVLARIWPTHHENVHFYGTH